MCEITNLVLVLFDSTIDLRAHNHFRAGGHPVDTTSLALQCHCADATESHARVLRDGKSVVLVLVVSTLQAFEIRNAS
jgi:hypothetical protein